MKDNFQQVGNSLHYLNSEGDAFGKPQVTITGNPSQSSTAPASKDTTDYGAMINSGIGLFQSAKGAVSAPKTASQLGQEIEAICGKQPHPLIGGKKKKDAWKKCSADYALAKQKQQTDAMAAAARSSAPAKSSGMGAGTIVAIAFGSILLIGGIYFMATRKPAQVIMQAPPVVG